MKYPVVRLDNVQGTHDGTKLRSAQIAAATEVIPNGTMVQLGALKEGEREIFVATMANETGKPLYLVATPEMMYETNKRALTDFVNEANGILRCYKMCAGDVFAVTAEYFGKAVPTKGQAVSVTEGKIVAGEGTIALGTCFDVEVVGSLTYYVIEVA